MLFRSGVTLNYRLGPLGFATLPELKEEAGRTGNYGLYDQLTAIKWVKNNIASYNESSRSMNRGKLDMVKKEIDILGISELKWMGMGKFNSDDHYIYYCKQESFRRGGVAITVNNSPKCSTWMQSQKQQNDLHSFPR